MADATRMKRLLALYLDGLASDGERAELAAWLRTHTDAAEPAWALIEADTHLRALLAAKAGADATVRSVLARLDSFESETAAPARPNTPSLAVRRGRKSRGGWLALAAALLAAAAMFLFVSDREQPSVAVSGIRVAVVSGETTIQRGDRILTALAGMSLVAGDHVRTVSGAEAMLEHADTGKTIRLAAETALSVYDPDARFHLISGRIGVSAPFMPDQTLVFTTPGARAVVVGTRFELVAAPNLTRLTVMDGTIDFSDTAREKTVRVEAGFGSVVAPWAEPTVFPMGTSDGLLALYLFNEGSGTTLHDVSGIGEPLHLTIRNPDKVEWLPDRLRVFGEANIAYRGPATKIVETFRESGGLTFEAETVQESSGQKDLRKYRFVDSQLGSTIYFWDVNSRTELEKGLKKQVRGAVTVQYSRGQATTSFYDQGQHAGASFVLSEKDYAGIERQKRFEMRFAPSLDAQSVSEGYRPWEGELLYLAVYGRVLSDEELRRNAESASKTVASRP